MRQKIELSKPILISIAKEFFKQPTKERHEWIKQHGMSYPTFYRRLKENDITIERLTNIQ